MLGKLLKQEFRATGRIMLPIFGALLILSVLANFSIRMMDQEVTNSAVLNFLFVFLIVVFVLGIFGAMLMTLLLMISRFHRNLLKDEGYLMHTLPVSVHGLVWSKMIVSLVWFIVTGLIVTAILFLTGLIQSGTNLADLFVQFPSWAELKEILIGEGIRTGDIARFFAEWIVLMIVGILTTCLHFYAAMAMGHMFNKDKILLSIVFFVVISFVLSLMTSLLGFRVNDVMLTAETFGPKEIFGFTHKLLVFSLGTEVFQGALLYFATTLSLRRGLNLA